MGHRRPVHRPARARALPSPELTSRASRPALYGCSRDGGGLPGRPRPRRARASGSLSAPHSLRRGARPAPRRVSADVSACARGPAPTGAETTMSVVAKQVRRLDRVIIRFAGDSGDGMQLTGDRFTSETASFGN
ncbi:hypothetical protein ACFUZB_35475, partial [Streptomyces sp. NPDC057382]